MSNTQTETTPHAELEHHRTIFDGWRSIALALYLALIGYSVMVGIPVISTAWVELLGFSEVQVGSVAGADLGGFALGSVITSLLIQRVNRRILVVAGVVLAVLANGLCTLYVEYDQVLWLRVVAGTGSGMITAIAIATLGATSRPTRAFNMLLFAFAFTQAGELYVLPQLSMNGIYGLFIALYLISLLFLNWLPPHAITDRADVEIDVTEPSGKHRHMNKHIPSYVPWFCLMAIFAIYISIGAYWTYIELANISAGIEREWINRVLVWGTFMSIFGCLVATLISDRIGISRPLMVALLAMAGVVGMLVGDITNMTLFFSVMFFNFLWLFIDVYQMGSMSVFDPSGKFVSLIPAAQGLGQIIGPNLAAAILGYGLGYDGVFIMCACAAITAMVIYGIMYVRLRRVIPALADAS